MHFIDCPTHALSDCAASKAGHAALTGYGSRDGSEAHLAVAAGALHARRGPRAAQRHGEAAGAHVGVVAGAGRDGAVRGQRRRPVAAAGAQGRPHLTARMQHVQVRVNPTGSYSPAAQSPDCRTSAPDGRGKKQDRACYTDKKIMPSRSTQKQANPAISGRKPPLRTSMPSLRRSDPARCCASRWLPARCSEPPAALSGASAGVAASSDLRLWPASSCSPRAGLMYARKPARSPCGPVALSLASQLV